MKLLLFTNIGDSEMIKFFLYHELSNHAVSYELNTAHKSYLKFADRAMNIFLCIKLMNNAGWEIWKKKR